MNSYVYQPEIRMDYESAVRSLESSGGHVVIRSGIDNVSPHIVKDIFSKAELSGMDLKPLSIDIDDYRSYAKAAEYSTRYTNYYSDNIKEKSFEHYLSLKFLEVKDSDVFIDVASENSPVPQIFSKLTGVKSYGQDIMYPKGIQGDKIGGDACEMPVIDGFASKVALTCSIEHFEGNADTKLFEELARILKPGGKVAIAPFYLFSEDATQTDPTISVPAGVIFDQSCAIYCAHGWGNRHGRFYSPESFMKRIAIPMTGKFQFDYYFIENAANIDPSIYLRFLLIATRL